MQCRHINYESLEAFLCVECGYCSYAHFGFRLTAAMETDFTPVTNEAELAEANRLTDQRIHHARMLQQDLERLRPRVCRLVGSLAGYATPTVDPESAGPVLSGGWTGYGGGAIAAAAAAARGGGS
ncbi:unnamed protein product, partial [Laminaria digitata]